VSTGKDIIAEAALAEAVGKPLFVMLWQPTKGAGILTVDTVNPLGAMASPSRAMAEAKKVAQSHRQALERAQKEIKGSTGYVVGHVTAPRNFDDTTITAVPGGGGVAVYCGGALAFAGGKLGDDDKERVEKIVGGHMADAGWRITKDTKPWGPR